MKKLVLILFIFLFLGSCSVDEENVVGPYFDSIYFGSESNNVWMTDSEIINIGFIEEHASVPDLIMLTQDIGNYKNGDLMTYFVDASSGIEEIGIKSSSDLGVSWSKKKNADISKIEDMRPVDPSIVQLEDGSLRLYFYDFKNNLNQDLSNIYSAKSYDGINFELEQKVFSYNHITDPEVIYFNGKWFMYLANNGNVLLAVSEDGLNFEVYQDVVIDCSIPGAFVDNGVYLYCNNYAGVNEFFSSDGYNFVLNSVVIKSTMGEIIGDSGPAMLSNGNKAMVLKVVNLNNPIVSK